MGIDKRVRSSRFTSRIVLRLYNLYTTSIMRLSQYVVTFYQRDMEITAVYVEAIYKLQAYKIAITELEKHLGAIDQLRAIENELKMKCVRVG